MKKIIFFATLTIILTTLTWFSASSKIAKDLNANIVRLHILANSDSAKDQQLKLKVRDRLLEKAGKTPELLSDGQIEFLCNNVLAENGCDDTVRIYRGTFYFPKKQYDNLTLPSGTYNAVRIVIGNGEGQNWWCIMYPPLCFTDESVSSPDEVAMDTLKHTLSPETFSMITESDHISVKPSFKLVELWQKVIKKGE